jgi:hypothetical protein
MPANDRFRAVQHYRTERPAWVGAVVSGDDRCSFGQIAGSHIPQHWPAVAGLKLQLGRQLVVHRQQLRQVQAGARWSGRQRTARSMVGTWCR